MLPEALEEAVFLLSVKGEEAVRLSSSETIFLPAEVGGAVWSLSSETIPLLADCKEAVLGTMPQEETRAAARVQTVIEAKKEMSFLPIFMASF